MELELSIATIILGFCVCFLIVFTNGANSNNAINAVLVNLTTNKTIDQKKFNLLCEFLKYSRVA